MSFHDLTTELQPPVDLRPLLGLGHKFIPTPKYSNGRFELADQSHATLSRFERALRIRCFFADQANPPEADAADVPPEALLDYNPRMYVTSNWKAPQHTFPWIIQRRFAFFHHGILNAFRKQRGRANLLPHQRRALEWAQTQDDFVICLSDKNLGFCIMEKTQYIRRARALLSDVNSYTKLDQVDADARIALVTLEIQQWIQNFKHVLLKSELKFLRRHHRAVTGPDGDPYATFYLLAKIHKDPIGQRPVVSYSGSLLYALSVWCDDKLQPLAKAQQSYLQSSFELKERLEALQLPPNAVFFTADARAMYTNIPTVECLNSIEEYLIENFDQFTHVDHDALLAALGIVMHNNIFRFGDTYWVQNNGAAMGAPPCPAWAAMYFAPYEDDSCDVFSDQILFYVRYIDDVFGIWLKQPGDNATWAEFQDHMNQSALVWDFSERSRSADFLDLTITFSPETGQVSTDLYEKPLNLHAYLPPHSAHPPGVLKGLVKGMLFRFKTLCTKRSDQQRHINTFYQYLLVRGYKPNGLAPLFNECIISIYAPPPDAIQPLPPLARPPDVHPLFFRIQYHPNDPPSTTLQKIWRTTLFHPPGSRPLSDLDSYNRNGKIGTNRMIVCYNRAPNLENLVSSKRNLAFKDGPTVSSFFDD